MSLNKEAIRDECRAMGVSTTDISDNDLDVLISHTFSVMNAYRPQVRSSLITTVAYQEDYNWPTDATAINCVLWSPTVNESTWWPLWQELEERFSYSSDFNNPSIMMILRSNMHEFDKAFGGHWDVIFNSAGVRKVRLFPMPTSVCSVPVIYSANFTEATFNDNDYDLFFEGVLSYARETVAYNIQKRAGWKAGEYSTTANSGENLLKMSSGTIKQWRARLSGLGFIDRT